MLIKSAVVWITKRLNSFTIAKDGVKYLTRYYLFGKDRKYLNIYIHEFHRSDLDKGVNGFGLLHNHPVPVAFGFVLANGYLEERRQPNGNITVKLVKPGDFNFLCHQDFHRVDLLAEDAWTIFVTGPRLDGMSWGFWDRVTKEYIDWKDVPGAIE